MPSRSYPNQFVCTLLGGHSVRLPLPLALYFLTQRLFCRRRKQMHANGPTVRKGKDSTNGKGRMMNWKMIALLYRSWWMKLKIDAKYIIVKSISNAAVLADAVCRRNLCKLSLLRCMALSFKITNTPDNKHTTK